MSKKIKVSVGNMVIKMTWNIQFVFQFETIYKEIAWRVVFNLESFKSFLYWTNCKTELHHEILAVGSHPNKGSG